MTVRAKFRVTWKDNNMLALGPVYTGSEENKAFFAATPGGDVRLYTTRPEVAAEFNLGDEFYVDFTKTTTEADAKKDPAA